MFPFSQKHPNGKYYCFTEYEADTQWLRATWLGFVTAQDGENGAMAILKLLELDQTAYLLNDNSQVEGPWFDSVDWLKQVWAPLARRLGLRYVAHVVQPHTEADITPFLTAQQPFAGLFDLQLFTTVEEAAEWLRDCQQRERTTATFDHQLPRAAPSSDGLSQSVA